MATKNPKKEFEDSARPLTAKEQVQMTIQLATDLAAAACPEADKVSAQVGGIKITLKRKQP